MTAEELVMIAKSLAPVVRDHIKAATDPLRARLDDLERELAQAKSAGPSVVYAGVHQSGRRYASGELVSKAGGLWLALQETSDTPGGHPADWRLVVKSGGAER